MEDFRSYRYSRGWCIDTPQQSQTNTQHHHNEAFWGQNSESAPESSAYELRKPPIPLRSPIRLLPGEAPSPMEREGFMVLVSASISRSTRSFHSRIKAAGKRLSVDTVCTNDSGIEINSRRGSSKDHMIEKQARTATCSACGESTGQQGESLPDVATSTAAILPTDVVGISAAANTAGTDTQETLHRVATRLEQVKQQNYAAAARQQTTLNYSTPNPHSEAKIESGPTLRVSPKPRKPSLKKQFGDFLLRLDEKQTAKTIKAEKKEDKRQAIATKAIKQRAKQLKEEKQARSMASIKSHEDEEHGKRLAVQQQRRRLKGDNKSLKQLNRPRARIDISAPLTHEQDIALWMARRKMRPKICCVAGRAVTYADQST